MKLLDANPHGRYRYSRRICKTVFHSASQERFCRGGVYIQKYFRNELRCIQVDERKFNRYRMAIDGLIGQRSIGVMVAGKMFMVGAWVVVSGASRAMTGGFYMQETDCNFVRGGKPCFLDLMGERKDGIDGKAGHHRYQGQCNDFSEILVQTDSMPFHCQRETDW